MDRIKLRHCVVVSALCASACVSGAASDDPSPMPTPSLDELDGASSLTSLAESDPDLVEIDLVDKGFKDSDGYNPWVAGCLTRFSDDQCTNPVGGIGESCEDKNKILIEHWAAKDNKTPCDANTCCPASYFVPLDCAAACQSMKKQTGQCARAENECGKDRDSARCECS